MPPSNLDYKNEMNERFIEITESMKLIFDLTSRTDERVKILIEKQNILDREILETIESNQSHTIKINFIEETVREKIREIKEKFQSLDCDTECEIIKGKIQDLEMKLNLMTTKLNTYDNRWMLVFDAIWKILLMCVAGYILYKLGFQAPSM
jgi:hypothetical protein